MPCSPSAVSSIAVDTLPGIPNDSVGTSAPAMTALLAASGPAIPAGWPLPKRSGSRLTCFSETYDRKVATVPPSPGIRPTTTPIPDPRTSARHSRRVRTIPRIQLPVSFIWLVIALRFHEMRTISEKAKIPIIIATRSSPS